MLIVCNYCSGAIGLILVEMSLIVFSDQRFLRQTHFRRVGEQVAGSCWSGHLHQYKCISQMSRARVRAEWTNVDITFIHRHGVCSVISLGLPTVTQVLTRLLKFNRNQQHSTGTTPKHQQMNCATCLH